ncbi:protein indeterminate-domain 12-like [Senna tora]|uniref:Protein indeterminate-domain 12-like n=1 Tax=Senna tora TaxID=362788 RepID=A0A834SJE6_9FABA|nr:protein indeterminate-domain 12-like [Senna tora]
MSNSTCLSQELATTTTTTVSSAAKTLHNLAASLNHVVSTSTTIPPPPQKIKKKRNLPGNPDPDAEVIALSPKSLLATNRFVCEVCNKGFQREQNLQLHRRGHNLPWKLKQRKSKEVRKRAYVCPEPSCVHHNPSRALGDLTGIKKHYCRKHGEKKWKCHKCSKFYAVHSDWRAHSKTCGTREYRCDCGTLFSRKDSFITHRAFCDALAEESGRIVTAKQFEIGSTTNPLLQLQIQSLMGMPFQNQIYVNPWDPRQDENPNPSFQSHQSSSWLQDQPLQQQHKSELHSATAALLQKAATAMPAGPGGGAVGPHSTMGHVAQTQPSMAEFVLGEHEMMMMSGNLKSEGLTRDFLGLTGDSDVSVNAGDMHMHMLSMSFTATGGVDYLPIPYVDHHSQQGFGLLGTTTAPETWGNA